MLLRVKPGVFDGRRHKSTNKSHIAKQGSKGCSAIIQSESESESYFPSSVHTPILATLTIMIRSISIALILLVLSGVSHAFQPSVPSTAHRSVTSGGKASSSALFDYVPKWKKKETLADSAGDMSEEDKGLMGIIPVIFKQGNETRRTLASPGQPLSFVAAQAGQSIRYGCKKGECGTCECMANGKWIRPCVETVPDWAPGQELVLNIKELKNKSKSSGKFYSVKSFFMGKCI